VTVLFVVGGVAGALLVRSGADVLLDQREIIQWLGE